MKKLLIIIFFSGLLAKSVFAQGELDEQQKIFFRNEKSFAGLLNSDGFGLSYRDAKRINFLNKRFFEFEIGTLRHPREYRQSNPVYQTPGTFVFGKIYTAFYLRGSFGHQRELFSKHDEGGIAIRFLYSAGPSFAIYKPIYYKVLKPISTTAFDIIEEKFDVNIHQPVDIYSRAPFTKGLKETKILPGLYIKSGFNFEYSKEDKIIHAVEVGASLTGYPKKIPIMASDDNKALFFSLFVSYRFGIVIDPLNPESNKISNIFKRKRTPPIY